MRRRAGWIAFALIGCRIGFDEVPPDASVDAIDAMPDATGCFGSQVKVCFDVLPRGPVMLDADTDIDTERSPLCDQHNDRMAEFCVVAGTDFTISSGAVIRGHGKKPLVLLAMNTIDVKGAIDVSSDHGAITGAGADPAACASGQLPVNAGGGHGGSFRGRGGRGKPSVEADPAAAAPDPLSAFPPLRGGCPGASGSTVGGGPGGRGGSGGGAVAFVARTLRIQVSDSTGCDLNNGRLNDGCVDASGAAGEGGALVMTGAGGGGGGSGGMIVLDVLQIQQRGGKLLASGGGGGQGGGPSAPGVPGKESEGPGTAAAGGIDAANNESGDGAAGSTGPRLDGFNAVDGVCETVPNCGGGGGGGGGAAGFIYAPVFPNGEIDPPPANP